MSATQYGNDITYGGTLCTGAVYGVQSCVDGNVGGTVSTVVEWTGDINLTSNVIIESGAAIVISCDANIISNGNTIIIQDNGYLNTRGNRLPRNSAIGSVIVFT